MSQPDATHGTQTSMPTWYDLFSLFYDRALEDLYAPYRAAAVRALEPAAGACVLDLPCGTGQSFDYLVPMVGESGSVQGVDRSAGMLRQARRRVSRAGWTNVALHRADAAADGAKDLAPRLRRPAVDAVFCALGLTALPHWERAFEAIFSLVRDGGRFVLLDVYAAESSRESRMVEHIARADLSRKAWVPLERTCDDFRREVLSSDVKRFGGELYVASGRKREVAVPL